MSQKLEASLRATLKAAGDQPVDLIIRTDGKPAQYTTAVAQSGVAVRQTFNLLPGLAVTAPASAILRLVDEAWIVSIEPDRAVHTM